MLALWDPGCSSIVPQLLGQISCSVHKENFKHSPHLHTGMFGPLYFLQALKTQEIWLLGKLKKEKERVLVLTTFLSTGLLPKQNILLPTVLKFKLWNASSLHWKWVTCTGSCCWYYQLFVLLQYLSNETNIYPHASRNIPGQCNFGLYKPNKVEHKEMFLPGSCLWFLLLDTLKNSPCCPKFFSACCYKDIWVKIQFVVRGLVKSIAQFAHIQCYRFSVFLIFVSVLFFWGGFAAFLWESLSRSEFEDSWPILQACYLPVDWQLYTLTRTIIINWWIFLQMFVSSQQYFLCPSCSC